MGLAKVHCGATPPSVMVLFTFEFEGNSLILVLFDHFLGRNLDFLFYLLVFRMTPNDYRTHHLS